MVPVTCSIDGDYWPSLGGRRLDLAAGPAQLQALPGAQFPDGSAGVSGGTGAKHLGAWWRAIRAVAAPDIVQREGKIIANLAVALEILTSGYVEFSVVGEPNAPEAQALFQAAQKIYEPRKILHFEKPGRYPDQGQAALFICNEDACSAPITDISDVALQAAKFKKLKAF